MAFYVPISSLKKPSKKNKIVVLAVVCSSCVMVYRRQFSTAIGWFGS